MLSINAKAKFTIQKIPKVNEKINKFKAKWSRWNGHLRKSHLFALFALAFSLSISWFSSKRATNECCRRCRTRFFVLLFTLTFFAFKLKWFCDWRMSALLVWYPLRHKYRCISLSLSHFLIPSLSCTIAS